MILIRLLLKLAALPCVAMMTLLQWVGICVASVSAGILNTLLGVVSMIVMGSWMLGLTSNSNVICGLTLCLILFLIPQIAKWLIVRIAAVNYTLREFVRS